MAGQLGGPVRVAMRRPADGRGTGSRDRARPVGVQRQLGRRQPQIIADKGTPFGDLLVPKLTASVTDGAVGVSVDSPVTVSAEDGVLGSVTMVNDDGEPVAGQAQPRTG